MDPSTNNDLTVLIPILKLLKQIKESFKAVLSSS